MENENSFLAHLYRSSEIVKEWPSWKQQVESSELEILNDCQETDRACEMQNIYVMPD